VEYKQNLRVAVLGAGAVGCFFGGMLARAGHPVTLIGRALHVDAFRAGGLHFEGLNFDEQVKVEAATEARAVAGAQLVLFSVKSTDTESAAREMAPWLAEDAVVLNLQNGVDNTERIAAEVKQPVFPAAVYVATAMAGPGHLKHHGRGDLVIGSPRGAADAQEAVQLERIRAAFVAAGVPVVVSDNVAGALWGKLTVNCAYNAISALGQMPYGRMIESVGIRQVMTDVVGEVLAVAGARGVRMAPDTLQAVLALAQAMATQFSSTAQDLARERPTEIDHLNGFIVRQGEALSIPVPANRALHALVKLVELRQAQK
jgi:2-dehydropantoate 2-reductase